MNNIGDFQVASRTLRPLLLDEPLEGGLQARSAQCQKLYRCAVSSGIVESMDMAGMELKWS